MPSSSPKANSTSPSNNNSNNNQEDDAFSLDPQTAIAIPIVEPMMTPQHQQATMSTTSSSNSRVPADPPALGQQSLLLSGQAVAATEEEKDDQSPPPAVVTMTTPRDPQQQDAADDEEDKENMIDSTVPTSGLTGEQDVIAAPPPQRPAWRSIAMIVAGSVLLTAIVSTSLACGLGSCASSNSRNVVSPIPPSPVAPVGAIGTKTSPPVVVAPTVAPVTAAAVTLAPTPSLTKLGRLQAGRQLSCGVMDLPGQSEVRNGERVGFSVDLCRALAAALFGTSEGTVLNIVPVEATNRFRLLQEGAVDVLAASVTHTMERDVHEPTTQQGYSFSIPYLYNGMSFAGRTPFATCADSLNTTACDASLNICVLDGTTYIDRVQELLPNVALSVVPTTTAFYENFRRGFCNVLAGDQFEISQSAVEQRGYFGDYQVGQNTYTKEPLALVTTEDDPTWSDFCNWVVQALLAAEEQGFTQDRFAVFKRDASFGAEYENMYQNALGEVGNYAEMYERNLAQLLPRSDSNMINTGTTGLIYGMPYGNPSSMGPNPMMGSTLQDISDRGFLRCGITRRAIFAEFDTALQEWKGLDIDFCKALSAAIFDGVTRTVVYSVLPATDRFVALAEGRVDVLSRITTVTLSRDVLETNAGVGFSFSQPDFYDGLSFGGIPPFGSCADRRDTTSVGCQALKICYNSGTTFEGILKELFPLRFLVSRQSGDLVAEGLEAGVCNAVAGGVVDVSASNIRNIGGYTGTDYETGSGRFSKDPLALVTRQDDPLWSDFVYWIVSSIFNAEEENISSSTSSAMPIVNLFGPFYTRIFRDAVEAVGSYEDIYERNVGSEVARGGLNSLNTNPLSPQHYPLPGL